MGQTLPGAVGPHRAGAGSSTLIGIVVSGVLWAAQGPAVLQVGRVSVVYWPGQGAAAAALGEIADDADRWPGIRVPPPAPIRVVIAPDRRRFDSLTGGRIPEWGGAATFPATRTIVLALTPDYLQTFRHELAHLALHSVARAVPRWFDEGYASMASGEWDPLEALRVNWGVLWGATPTLDDLSRAMRQSSPTQAETAYAFATTAVLLLQRLGGERGLEPLIGALAHTGDFDLALRSTYQMTQGQFEERWRHELRTRYGWLLFATSFSVFWASTALLLAALWTRRRRRDRARYLALDDGWEIPEDEWNPHA